MTPDELAQFFRPRPINCTQVEDFRLARLDAAKAIELLTPQYDVDQHALNIAEAITKLLPMAANPTKHKARIQVFILEILLNR